MKHFALIISALALAFVFPCVGHAVTQLIEPSG